MHYILWKVNYETLSLMLADAPRYTSEREDEPPKKQTIEQIFQSRLNHA